MHEKGRLLLRLFCSLSTRGKEEETAEGAEGGWGGLLEALSCRKERREEGGRGRRRDGAMLRKPSCGDCPASMHR